MEEHSDRRPPSQPVNPYASPGDLGAEEPMFRSGKPSFTDQPVYVRAAGLRKTVVVMHFVLAGLLFIYCLTALFYSPGELSDAGEDAQDVDVFFEEMGDQAIRAGVLLGLGILCAVVELAALILLSIWSFRAYRNLSVLTGEFLRFGPGWVVAYWYIPVVSLFRPVQAMNDIWRLSSPKVDGQAIWRTPAFLVIWWSLEVVSSVLDAVNTWVLDAEPFGDVWITFASLVAVVLGGLLVRFLGALQDARAKMLEVETV